MVEITWEINGKKVSANNFGNALEAAVFKSVQERISQAVGSTRCAVHGKAAQITVRGRDLKDLNFEVKGCCEALIEQVRIKLK